MRSEVVTDPKRIAEMKAGMEVVRRNSEALNARYDELFAAYPEEWVTVHDGRVFHAATSELLFEQVESAGLRYGDAPREFMGHNRPPLLL